MSPVVWQVVELISSAIGDVVQGIYSESYSNTEVRRVLRSGQSNGRYWSFLKK